MACNTCMQHRKQLASAIKNKDVKAATIEIVSATRTMAGKAGKVIGRATVKKRPQ